MKLYHVSQNQNRGYDTFSDFVVCAESEEEARNTHPRAHWYKDEDPWNHWNNKSWCSSPIDAKVEYIGEAALHIEKGIICSSFHAG